MDWIELTGLSGFGYHGVFDFERHEGQNFTVDVRIGTDFAAAIASDELEHTIHYGEVAERVHAHISGPPQALIERLAGRIAEDLLQHYPLIQEIWVTVHKPQAPIEVAFENVRVSHHRRRATSTAGTASGGQPQSEHVAAGQPAAGTQQHQAVLALGSNLGDSRGYLRAAVAALQAHPQISVLGASPLARTRAVGGPAGQPDYLNQVLRISTSLKPFELLGCCQQIEADAHRERTIRWGPRTLDIDVISYDDLNQDSPVLTLPHPRASQRAFVLAPWSWLEPEATLGGVKIRQLLTDCADVEEVERIDD